MLSPEFSISLSESDFGHIDPFLTQVGASLIPKNPKSSNFGKFFLPFQNWPEKQNIDIFRQRIFQKMAKSNSKFQSWKMNIVKNVFSYRNQRKIVI